jgi:hypothetical protein
LEVKAMFCSECGTEATGNFCWKCGARLARPGPQDEGSKKWEAAAIDWSHEIRYEVIARQPQIRELLAREAASAKRRLTGEEFLAAIDKIANFGVSLSTLAGIAQPLTARLGIGTGKSRSGTFNLPPGRVIAGVLCSMARRGHTLQSVEQAPDGCVLQAALPSDMWSLEGDLFITIRRLASATAVEAATKVRGQLFDWGKSKAVLEDLFNDIPRLPV